MRQQEERSFEEFLEFAGISQSKSRVGTHPNYSLEPHAALTARGLEANQGEGMIQQSKEAKASWRIWTMSAMLGLATLVAGAQTPGAPAPSAPPVKPPD